MPCFQDGGAAGGVCCASAAVPNTVRKAAANALLEFMSPPFWTAWRDAGRHDQSTARSRTLVYPDTIRLSKRERRGCVARRLRRPSAFRVPSISGSHRSGPLRPADAPCRLRRNHEERAAAERDGVPLERREYHEEKSLALDQRGEA